MAVRNFEIGWVNDLEGYGLFATKSILPGTKIFEEKAVVLPTSELNELIKILYLWKTASADDIFLYESTKATLRAQQTPIASKMELFKTQIVKNTPSYNKVMERHASRRHPASTEIPQMSSSLYHEIIGTKLDSASADLAMPWALRNINDYFLGALDIRSSQSTVWGPHTAFINHACRPNAAVVCLSKFTKYEEVRHENIGLIAVHALTQIEEGEQITIEYWPTLGDLQTRREELKRVGIGKCECNACASEEQLSLQAEDTEEYKKWQWLEQLNRSARTAIEIAIPMGDDNRTPASSIQSIWTCLEKLEQLNYHGILVWFCLSRMMDIAKSLNDGVRVHWLAQWAQKYALKAYGKRSQQYLDMVEDQQFSARESRWYNGRYIHSVCDRFDLVESDARKIFMVEHYPFDHYHFLQPTPDGSLVPISMEENSLHTTKVLKDRVCKPHEADESQRQENETPTTLKNDREAAERADHAALIILAEEAGRESRAEQKRKKESDRKKGQRDRRKAEKAKLLADAVAAQNLLADAAAAQNLLDEKAVTERKLAEETENREHQERDKLLADAAADQKRLNDEAAAEKELAEQEQDRKREKREKLLVEAAAARKRRVEKIESEKQLVVQKRRDEKIAAEKKLAKQIEDRKREETEENLARSAAIQKRLDDRIAAVVSATVTPALPPPHRETPHVVEVSAVGAAQAVDQQSIADSVAETTLETSPEVVEAIRAEVTPEEGGGRLTDETPVIERVPAADEASVTEALPTIEKVLDVEEPVIVPEALVEEVGPMVEEADAVHESSVADTAPMSPAPVWSSPIFSAAQSPASTPPLSTSKALSEGSLTPSRTSSPPPILEAEPWQAPTPPHPIVQTPPAAPVVRSASPIPLESPTKPTVRLPPFLVITPPRAPTPPPQHRRFRASSNPEAAMLERWMANEALRVPDFNHDDEIATSESELDLRKWYQIRRDVDWKIVATKWVIRWLE